MSSAEKTNLSLVYDTKGLVAESGVSFFDVVKKAPEPQRVATPHPTAPEVYDQMLKRYARLEERVLQETRP